MQKTYPIHLKQGKGGEAKVSHFSLPGLFSSGQTLALNAETRTLSLLRDGPVLVTEQRFSVNEMSILMPILESFPHYCPHEVLLSHISSNTVTTASIARWRQRLWEAQTRGAWQQELRPLRRALSSLRSKLHCFDLEISNVRERGYSLTSLRSASP
jgi:DNA-binding winged helix-turn-helix (wHTH) protein